MAVPRIQLQPSSSDTFNDSICYLELSKRLTRTFAMEQNMNISECGIKWIQSRNGGRRDFIFNINRKLCMST